MDREGLDAGALPRRGIEILLNETVKGEINTRILAGRGENGKKYHVKHEPEKWPLDEVDPRALEAACAAWYNYGLWPGQSQWNKMVIKEDHRIELWREQVHAAIVAYLAYVSQSVDAAGAGALPERKGRA